MLGTSDTVDLGGSAMVAHVTQAGASTQGRSRQQHRKAYFGSAGV